MRAAALAWRVRSCVIACCSSAARSAASTEPWVGRTQAVGQRVIPLVRMKSAITASRSAGRASSCLPMVSPRPPPLPRVGANRGITLTSAMMIMRRERPNSRPTSRAAATAARPAMPLWLVPWRPGLSTEREIFAEDGAVQQNAGALTQYCGPSTPPGLALRSEVQRCCRPAGDDNIHRN